jgi:hypothetical protein
MAGMPEVRLSPAIRRQVDADPLQVEASTTREALEAFFAVAPQARSWVVDDRGCPWPHVALFVDGKPVADRENLNDALQPDSVVEVWPALSGG